MGFFFLSSVRLAIISYGGLTVSGGGSMTVRAAALQRAGRLQISVGVFFSSAIGADALIQRTSPPGTTAVGRPFSSLVHLALKMKLHTSCRQVQAASDGALLFISSIEQPDAALPYVAVRHGHDTHPAGWRIKLGFLSDLPSCCFCNEH